jgi:hypothetical protein
MSKRTKNYSDIVELVNQGKVRPENRNSEAGISIHLFNDKCVANGYSPDFYLNKENTKGVSSINNYSVRGKKIISPVELTAKDKQLRADINIYSLSTERQNALLEEMSAKNFSYEHTGETKGKGSDKGKCRIKCKDLDQFFEIVDAVANIDELVAKSSGGGVRIATQLCELSEADENHFLSTAATYKVAIETKNQRLLNNFRTLLGADSIDHMITKGWSDEYKTLCHDDEKQEKSRREHVVPCVRIHNRVIEMFQSGSTIEEVAEFIEKHLVIVMISDRQRIHVDNTLSLRDSMPENWTWGDDIYARLTAASITWQKI